MTRRLALAALAVLGTLIAIPASAADMAKINADVVVTGYLLPKICPDVKMSSRLRGAIENSLVSLDKKLANQAAEELAGRVKEAGIKSWCENAQFMATMLEAGAE